MATTALLRSDLVGLLADYRLVRPERNCRHAPVCGERKCRNDTTPRTLQQSRLTFKSYRAGLGFGFFFGGLAGLGG